MIHGSILLKRIHQPIKISRLLIHDLKRKIEQKQYFFILHYKRTNGKRNLQLYNTLCVSYYIILKTQ